jgi:anti-sigma-K factor RskA
MTELNRHDAASDCDAITELVADYAFGLTSADESRLVESRLTACPEASSQLADFRRLQDEMRLGVPQIEPPAALGDRIMAAAAATVTTAPQPRITPLNANRGWLAAAAAIALLLLTNIYWLTRVSEPLPDQLATFVVNSEDIRWAKLPAEDENSAAAAFIMWNPGGTDGMMYAENFPPLEAGQIYQLWLTKDGVRTPVGSFSVNEEGEAALLFSAEQPVGSFVWAWITVEPETGSAQPSDNVVTGGEL